MRIALKIDVDTYRGTREGVPRLVELLQRHGAGATFFFSLGPDHTGRALKRVFRPGFLSKVSRTSVLEHYGLLTLLYGVLLPGPDIGWRCPDILLKVRDAGFETGIHCWDHVRWQDGVAGASADWAEAEMRRACDRYQAIFGAPARAHAAAGWQMSRAAYRLTQRLGFEYASDTRGTAPFMPVCDGELVLCPQLPTTLPTFDELIGLDGVTVDNVHERVLAAAATGPDTGHVFTLHAELEGMKLAGAFERLLEGWRARGCELVSLRTVFEALAPAQLPRHAVGSGEVPGRSGGLALQGEPFLA